MGYIYQKWTKRWKDGVEDREEDVYICGDDETGELLTGSSSYDKNLVPKDICEQYGKELKGTSIYPVQPDGTIDPASPYVVSPSGQGYYPAERVNAEMGAVMINAGFPGKHSGHKRAMEDMFDDVGAYESFPLLVQGVADRLRYDRQDDRGTRPKTGGDPSADPYQEQHTNRNFKDCLEYGDIF